MIVKKYINKIKSKKSNVFYSKTRIFKTRYINYHEKFKHLKQLYFKKEIIEKIIKNLNIAKHIKFDN